MGQGAYVEKASNSRGTRSTVVLKKISDSEVKFDSFPHENFSETQTAETIKLYNPIAVSLPDTSIIQELFIRALDIIGSLSILLCFLPVMLISSILIKLTSKGPVLYKQERVGKKGNIFQLYKFRTMINNAEKGIGPVLARKDDDRVTLVGKFLRKTRLDELPQLINIIKGEMSLVGPRPERPFFVKRHKALQGVRLSIKPGLTGFAQIRAMYNLKPDHKLKYDYLYIQRRSVLLNVLILIKTVPVVLSKKGW